MKFSLILIGMSGGKWLILGIADSDSLLARSVQNYDP